MARIRTIKPEFFTSEDIVSLSAFSRLLYIALWCEADREGRFRWRPKTFKLRYFPADDIDIQQCCDEIIRSGMVRLYGDGLAYIPSFTDHQHINPRESQSDLPAPTGDIDPLPQPDASSRVSDASSRDSDTQVGREGKGKERNNNTRVNSKTSFAEFVTMTDDEHAKLVSEFGEQGTEKLIDKLNSYKGASGKKYKSDYMAIRQWVIESVGVKPISQQVEYENDYIVDYIDDLVSKGFSRELAEREVARGLAARSAN